MIVDAGPEPAPEGLARVSAIPGAAPSQFASVDEAIAFFRRYFDRSQEEELRYNITQALKQNADGTWTLRYDPALRSGNPPMSVAPPSVEERWAMLARITCPTLLIRAADSDLLSRETAERMVRVIPNCRLVEVPGSNHPVPFDNPEGFLQAVDEFLSS